MSCNLTKPEPKGTDFGPNAYKICSHTFIVRTNFTFLNLKSHYQHNLCLLPLTVSQNQNWKRNFQRLKPLSKTLNHSCTNSKIIHTQPFSKTPISKQVIFNKSKKNTEYKKGSEKIDKHRKIINVIKEKKTVDKFSLRDSETTGSERRWSWFQRWTCDWMWIRVRYNTRIDVPLKLQASYL